MGKMNLLKGKWDGKVGETVGAKWKNKSTIRTYSVPSNPNTQAQQDVRGAFKLISQFVALFADGIKYLSALDTSGMSVRNAIIKINKEMIAMNSFDKANLLISKGGLQKPMNVEISLDGTSKKAAVTFDKPTATNITAKAKIVVVLVDETNTLVDIVTADASTGTASGAVAFDDATKVTAYAYFLDYRGSNKVASESVNVTLS